MEVEPLPKALASSGIAGGRGLMALFASHPSMEERIAALSAQGR
jgi:heat shock protein HtpX